jgi:hypothetical protein
MDPGGYGTDLDALSLKGMAVFVAGPFQGL